ncbi:MAG TPA: YbhB/YbcL family Raf kinase inhibitor-like protein [Candidatus Paceibacterota bacterium]
MECGFIIIQNMELTSRDFKNKEFIPSRFTCDGENINPSLQISGVTKGANSLALIVDDPDAPGSLSTGGWVHWVLWNINPDTVEIKIHGVPPGAIEGVTSFGRSGYGGPCPPSGTHRYFFKLYALNAILDLPESADKKMLEARMNSHIIETAELIGLYKRE